MGKRYVDHDSTLDTPTNKKRKTDSSHQPLVDNAIEHSNQCNDLAAAGSAADVTYLLTTDIVDGAILTDLCAKKWRCGKPIGMYLVQWIANATIESIVSAISICALHFQAKAVLARFS